MNDIVENSKQYEYLMKIRDVGMKIIFKKTNDNIISNSFMDFEQYIEDTDVLYKFVQSLGKIDKLIKNNMCSPDDLLMELGQYTPYIIYDDEAELVKEDPLYNIDDGWLYK